MQQSIQKSGYDRFVGLQILILDAGGLQIRLNVGASVTQREE